MINICSNVYEFMKYARELRLRSVLCCPHAGCGVAMQLKREGCSSVSDGQAREGVVGGDDRHVDGGVERRFRGLWYRYSVSMRLYVPCCRYW